MTTIPDYDWTREEAAFVKAMWDGKADAHMQRAVLKHIVEMLGAIGSVGFDPDNAQITAFYAGRKWLARQIQIAITQPLPKEPVNEPTRRSVPTTTERAARAAAKRAAPVVI